MQRYGLDPSACLSLDMPVRYGQLSEHLKRASLLNMERDVAALPSSGPTGNSAVMRRVRKLIEQVAGFDTTVLVTGESGTGKAVVARALHERSPSRAHPLVPVNCDAMQSELRECELCGPENGPFTDATTQLE